MVNKRSRAVRSERKSSAESQAKWRTKAGAGRVAHLFLRRALAGRGTGTLRSVIAQLGRAAAQPLDQRADEHQ